MSALDRIADWPVPTVAAAVVANADPVPVRITPDWRSDPDTALESAVMRRRGDRGVVVSLIDHAKEPRTVEVTM
ncbi:MAG TPA: hypothetical protein P5061_08230, partial [Mycobacterium sp.]|nr:hypothetical protein [Mycobacterium sp.]